MDIISKVYIKEGSNDVGSMHYLLTTFWFKVILQKLRNKKFDHLNWIGIVDSKFIDEPTPFLLVFYNGDWDPKEIVNVIIEDIEDPITSMEDIPSPFSDTYKKSEYNREIFVKNLKGENIF